MCSHCHKLVSILLSLALLLAPFAGVTAAPAVAHPAGMHTTHAAMADQARAADGATADCAHCCDGQCSHGTACEQGGCGTCLAVVPEQSRFFRVDVGRLLQSRPDRAAPTPLTQLLFRPPRA